MPLPNIIEVAKKDLFTAEKDLQVRYDVNNAFDA